MSNLKKIEGGVTTPQGFTAGAVYTAIKKRENKKPDVAVLYSDLPCSCAASNTPRPVLPATAYTTSAPWL